MKTEFSIADGIKEMVNIMQELPLKINRGQKIRHNKLMII
jgi:hypothetical protein